MVDIVAAWTFYSTLRAAYGNVSAILNLARSNVDFMEAASGVHYKAGIRELTLAVDTADLTVAGSDFGKAHDFLMSRIKRRQDGTILNAHMYDRAARAASMAVVCYGPQGKLGMTRYWATEAREAFQRYAESEHSAIQISRTHVSFGRWGGGSYSKGEMTDVEDRHKKEREELEKAIRKALP